MDNIVPLKRKDTTLTQENDAKKLETYGLRTFIATAPITAAAIDTLTQSLFEQKNEMDVTKRILGAVLFVFAPWCGCCQNFVSEYNRIVSLLPVMTNTVVGWIPDSEVLSMRDHATNPIVQKMGNSVDLLPSVFFLDDKGRVIKGTMQTYSDPIIDAYLDYNVAAKQHTKDVFWPQLAKSILTS